MIHRFESIAKAIVTLCAVFILLMLSNNAQAQLQAGQFAPDFSAPAALAGKPYQFKLAEALTRGPVVVYFYPKAFTAGCTIEAQMFAQRADAFQQVNTTVVGVSSDDIETLKRFSEGPCGGKFAVASDANHQIMQNYGAARRIQTGMADRISYVIAPDSRIIAVIHDSNPVTHVESSLLAVQKWQQTKPLGSTK